MTEANAASKKVLTLAKEKRSERVSERKKRKSTIYFIIAGILVLALIIFLLTRGQSKSLIKPAATVKTKNQAVELFNKGDFKKAIPQLKVYVDEHPDDTGARTVLAQSYWLNGKNKEALAQYLEIIKIKPNDADTLYRLGILYGLLQQNNKAIGSLEKATKINPRLAVFQAELAKAYARGGKYDLAIGRWNKAMALTPASNKSYRANVFAEIGNLYVVRKDKAKAKEAYQQGLAIEPENTYLKSQLGKLGGK